MANLLVKNGNASGSMVNYNQSNSVVAGALATVQAEIMRAEQRPRDFEETLKNLEGACSRMSLAKSAVYAYARGGSTVSGPSIRLAEAIAVAYKNISYGYDIIQREEKSTLCKAYAWDLENNIRVERNFIAEHTREAKGKTYPLTSDRDIYEKVASEASRRVRACILEVIPGDITDYAVDLCHRTVENNVKITPEVIDTLLSSFSKFGVSKKQLEAFIQRNINTISSNNYLRLKDIYASLRDGIATPDDFFKREEEIDAENKGKDQITKAVDVTPKEGETTTNNTTVQSPSEEDEDLVMNF